MFKKALGIILGLGLGLVIPSSLYAQTIGAQPGVPQTVYNAVDLTSPAGTSNYAYSLAISNNGNSAITWQTSFSAAPSTITTVLLGSVDCNTFSTVDTSTNVNGEIRTIFGSYKCLTFNQSVATGGAGKTLTVKFVYSTGRPVGSTTGNTVYTGGVFTGPILLPDGTAAAPSMAFVSAPTTGFYFSSSAVIYSLATTPRVKIDGSLTLFSTGAFRWTATDAVATADTFLSRGGAATLQLGAADAASPISQTLQAQGVAAGTSDVAGGNLTIKPGLSRGNAVPSTLVLNRSFQTSSGSTAQSQGSAIIPCGMKVLSTTSATAQTILTQATTTSTSGGFTVYYSVSAAAAGAADAATGSVHVSWNNPSGTVASTMGTVINEVQSNSSGTLTATPTVTVASNVVSFKLTPTWVTITPTAVRGFFIVFNQSLDPISCQ